MRYLDVDDGVDVVAFQKKLRLRSVARKTVQHEIVFGQAADDDLVWHELTRVDDAPHARQQLGVRLDIPAKDVADTDVDDVEVFREQLGLRSLTTALEPP